MTDKAPVPETPEFIFDRLENQLLEWHELLTNRSSNLTPAEGLKLVQQWNRLRLSFDVASLHQGLTLAELDQVLEPSSLFRSLKQDELELTADALQNAGKTLQSLLSETSSRKKLLEEALNTDKPAKIRGAMTKLKLMEEGLQTRLLGLDAYIEQFHQAEIPGQDLAGTVRAMLAQHGRIQDLTAENLRLDEKKIEMKRWLDEAEAQLAQKTFAPPPSPADLEGAGASVSASSEANRALGKLYAAQRKLVEARLYLEEFLAPKRGDK